jgi:hypothetical protein
VSSRDGAQIVDAVLLVRNRWLSRVRDDLVNLCELTKEHVCVALALLLSENRGPTCFLSGGGLCSIRRNPDHRHQVAYDGNDLVSQPQVHINSKISKADAPCRLAA